MDEALIKRIVLSRDLVLEFSDRSNRYFGDYHRILIEIDAQVESADQTVRLRYQRPLKKMGVCSAEAGDVTESLIEQFLATTVTYMGRAGFTQKLLDSLERPGQRLWKLLGQKS